MRISAAIIVKNEEKVIRRCLECVSKFADEIVIVDTGSTDRTKEMIEGHNVCLIDSKHFGPDTDYGDFRFGIARNEALDKCTGDWVCIPAGHLVCTENGMLPIEKISKGVKVLTHTGKLKRVIKTGKRCYKKDVVCLRARSNGDVLRLTPEHRVLAIRSYKCHLKKGSPCIPSCRKQFKGLPKGGVTRNCKQPYKNYVPSWIAAGELEEGDIVLLPRPSEDVDDRGVLRKIQPSAKKRKVRIQIDSLDYDLGRLIGFYLAEGCVDRSRSSVNFTFHWDESEYHHFIEKKCAAWGANVEIVERRNQNTKTLRVPSAALCDVMGLFGHGAKEKCLPLWVLSANNTFLKGIFHGWMQGDGGERKDGIQGKSISASIIYGMRLLLAKLGVVSCYTKYDSEHGEAYNLAIGGIALDNPVVSSLASSFRGKRSKSYQLTALNESFFLMPLTKVWREDFDGSVFNIEVEGDNSYVCSGVTVHNCWWDADDVIDDEGAARIRALATEETCVRMFAVSCVGTRWFQKRMFRNGQGVRFDDKHGCHEYLLTGSLPSTTHEGVVVKHVPCKKSISSTERNLRILEKDYFDREMRDQRTLFYLAGSYREAHRYQEAIELYEKYLEASEWAEERFYARLYTARCWLNIGKLQKAKAEAFRAIAEDGRFAEAFCFLGDLCSKLGQRKRAILWYELAMTMKVPKAILFVETGSYGSYPRNMIRQLEAMDKVLDGSGVSEDVSEVMLFDMPGDRMQSILAMCALHNCAKQNQNTRFEVVCLGDWHRKVLKASGMLFEGSVNGGSVKSLRLPDNLRARHPVDWYCRSAGFIVPSWEPLDWSKADEDVRDEIRRAMNV